MKRIFAAAAAVAALSGAMPALAETVAEKVAANPDLSTLAAALDQTGLMANLEGGPVTLFAPTNKAFAALPADARAAIADETKLKDVLLYHVIQGEYDTGKLAGAEVGVAMANGAELIGVAKDGLTLDGGSIVVADVRASNGVIHIIDHVMLARD